jgi:hypothetical protein
LPRLWLITRQQADYLQAFSIKTCVPHPQHGFSIYAFIPATELLNVNFAKKFQNFKK